MQRDTEAVYLHFGHVFELAAIRQPLAAFCESLEVIQAVRIVQRHQRHCVNKRLESFGFSAYALGWAVGRDQTGMFRLQGFQPFKQAIKFLIGNLRGIGLII